MSKEETDPERLEKFTKLRGEVVPLVQDLADSERRSFANMLEVLAMEALAARQAAEVAQ